MSNRALSFNNSPYTTTADLSSGKERSPQGAEKQSEKKIIENLFLVLEFF